MREPLYKAGELVEVAGDGVGLSGTGTVVSIGGTLFGSQHSYEVNLNGRTVSVFEEEIRGRRKEYTEEFKLGVKPVNKGYEKN